MKIPLPTQIMLEASAYRAGLLAGSARRRWPRLLSACAPTSEPPPGGSGGTRSRLRVPLLGDALRKAETARFARAMGTLVANSVPLVQSIGIAARHPEQPAHRRVARSAWRRASSAAKASPDPLRKAGEFPPLAAHLLTVGEETGRLDADVRPHGRDLRKRNARRHPSASRRCSSR